jgi:hypothetical protein
MAFPTSLKIMSSDQNIMFSIQDMKLKKIRSQWISNTYADARTNWLA